jgi:hypothetical protein
MKNYGEELVYWYFRLNGFIPMTNFVLHGDDVLKGSDCDLVAVRFPHVYEKVGGQDNDWDARLLEALGHDGEKTLITFVQVKTGQGDGDQVAEIAKYFAGHLDYLVKRVGFWPVERAAEIADAFNRNAVLPQGQYVLSKMVVLRTPRRRHNHPAWIDWPFGRAIHFIMNRMLKYAPDKFEDRMHFPDSIIQFLVDQAHTQAHRWPVQNEDSPG